MTESAGRWRAFGRFALFVALANLALGLVLPLVVTLISLPGPLEIGFAKLSGPRTFLEIAKGYAFLAVAGGLLAALLWPVTLILCAPIWFVGRAWLRRRGTMNRRSAALTALPCAAAFGLNPVVYLSAVPATPPEGAAAVAFLVTAAMALVVAPLSALAVHRDD